MHIETNDFASLKEIIFKEVGIKDIDDLKSHENYRKFDYVRFFECIDDVIGAAKEEDKAYFAKLKEAMDHCRDYSDIASTLEELDNEKSIILREQSECSSVKNKNMVRSVFKSGMGVLNIGKVVYDTPKTSLIANSVFYAIAAVAVLLLVIVGNGNMSRLPLPMFILAGFWLVNFIEVARKLGPYEDACEKEAELSEKYSKLTSKINETEDKGASSKKEAYICYRDLSKWEENGKG